MEHRATHARKDYEQGSLDETTVARDPVRQFAAWYDAAVAAGGLPGLRSLGGGWRSAIHGFSGRLRRLLGHGQPLARPHGTADRNH